MYAIKFVLLRSVFLLSLFLGLTLGLNAQATCKTSSIVSICEQSQPVPPIEGCGYQDFLATIDFECTNGYVPITIFCTNIPGEPDQNGYYQWPANMPPLYAAYEYDNNVFQYTDEIVNWEYAGSTLNGNKRFVTTINVYSSQLTGNFCPGKTTESWNFDMVVKLVMPGFGGFHLYPIATYSDPGGIFSCEEFAETCYNCPGQVTGANCDGFLKPIFPISVCVDCSNCPSPPIPNPGDNSRHRIVQAQNNFNVFPNPFSNSIQFSFQSINEQQDGSVNIYHANGQLITSKSVHVKRGDNSYTFESEDFAEGLYIIEFKTADFHQVQQLIKIE